MKTNELIFHVYEKKDNRCIFHSLTVEDIEDKLRKNEIRLGAHEIEPVEQRVYEESPSY
jgi:hypothetical protein